MRVVCIGLAAAALAICVAPLEAQGTTKTPTKELAPSTTTPPTLRATAVRSCPSMVQGQVVRLPDNGYLETMQGWFDRAWIDREMLYCGYGVDKARPADRPAGVVHYDLAGHKAADCQVLGPTLSCTK